MKFTYYGHACFLVEVAGKKLLFDPFISGNDLANDVEISGIECDYILLSHGHSDHVVDVFRIADNNDAQVIAMVEVANWVEKKGYKNTFAMNMGPVEMEFGQLRMLPGQHSSSLPDGSYGGSTAGFLIKSDEGSFYYAGDTCLTMEMKLLPYYAKLDYAIMPIGGHFTMNAEDAVIAAEFAEVSKVIGVHYNTWPPISIDTDKAQEAFKNTGRELLLPGIGETITV